MQKLLDSDSLTKYQFKKPKNLQAREGASSQASRPAPELSPFARMVLDSADVPFRYLTPESPGTQNRPAVNGTNPSATKIQKRIPTPQSTVKPETNQQNGFPPLQNDGLPQSSHAAPSSQVLQAVVPGTLSAAELAGIQYVADTSEGQSGKSRPTASNGSRTISVDQRQKGDAAVAALQILLNEIFTAEDNFDPDDMSHSKWLTVADSDDGRVPILQRTAQEQLDTAVQSVAKYVRLDSMDVEDLVRVQKFNERAVSAANSTNLQIGEDWSQDDVQFWLTKLDQAESSLLAARTLFRVMNAGRQEKELQSEDHVRAALDLLKTIIDTGLVPVAEERSFVGERVRGGDKPQYNPKFVLATNHRSGLQSLLHAVTKSLRLLAILLSRVDVDESAISSIVYMCKSLIFAENAGTEKESVLGIQPFESTRKYAMDVLGRIFTRYTDQRLFVIDEILVSLEKLPATKQSARQYRLPDGKPIQLVSALLMRLVQTSATRNSTALHLRSKAVEDDDDEDDEDAEGSDEDVKDDDSDDDDYGGIQVSNKKKGVPNDLVSLVSPLHDAARSNASYIVRMLIQRASTTAKNSDEPYRKLIDIFTEDFLNVLGSSDWPAAELLLQIMLNYLVSLAENPKATVPARNLGLELMGMMGSGILGLQMQTRSVAKNVDRDESPLTNALVTTFHNADINNKDIDSRDLLDFNGPYRFVLEYLRARDNGNDAQVQTAKGYLLVHWAMQLCGARSGSVDSENSDAPDMSKSLSEKLRNIIVDPEWLEENYDFKTPSTTTGRFASLLVTINTTFCKAFHRLFSGLVNALTDEHTLVKSRAIKSILTVVEKDPEVLARNVHLLHRILNCMKDKSALVRESALSLVQRCLALRPELAGQVHPHVALRAMDPMSGVRKKAFKVLKDLYLNTEVQMKSGSLPDSQLKVRLSVANALIEGMKDAEESVLELVRSILEELWFAPFHGLSLQGDTAVQTKLKYRSQAQLLTSCVDHNKQNADDLHREMGRLIRDVTTKSKTAPANERVCKVLVEVLFDGMIDPEDIPGSPSAAIILQTLTIFAKACPTLMNAAQLERLEPYTNNLNKSDDLNVYRSVLAILRYAMPHVNNLGHDILMKLQSSLMKSIGRLPKTEITEVAACLWTIDGELQNTERLVNLMASAMANIRSMSKADFTSDPKQVSRVTKLMNIVGQFGKACDFESQFTTFQQKFSWSKSRSVADLAIEVVCPFTNPKQPIDIREAALDAICAISQRWPNMFLREDVGGAFNLILKEKAHSLEEIFVSGLEGFFAMLGVPSETQQDAAAAPVTGRERLARTYVASDQDGASSALAQKFLPDIICLAESSATPGTGDELALTATKLIASILQQGLPHPKECGPTLVALETSPNTRIAQIAFSEHRVMHQKHETVIEKEYVRSVQRSLNYQHRISGGLAGFTGSPPQSKLHYFWDVLKSGKLKVRHKFISNICQKLEFEPARLDVRTSTPPELTLARYVCENLAFFDYDRTDDLLKLLSAFEKSFASVGTPVAQAIESEVLKLNVESMLARDPMAIGTMTGASQDTSINPARLRTLAISSQILLIIWETRTYLLRLWNLQKIVRNSKAAIKENSKAPSRANTTAFLTDAYLKAIPDLMAATATSEQQHALCERFVEVTSVDSEAKIPSEDEDEMAVTGGAGDASDSDGATPPVGGKSRKRKSGGSSQNTPRKKVRPRNGSMSKSVDGDEDGAWD